jgi:hypothetical protein
MRNNLAKRAILQLVFLSTLLIFLSLTNVPGQTPQPIYKVGDYFVYKLEETVTGTFTATGTVTGISCSLEADIRVNITKIDLPYVYAKGNVKNVKTSGECPTVPGLPPFPTESVLPETSFRIDEKPSAEPKLFVDPSYSGPFQTSTTSPYGPYGGMSASMSYKYNKGVLISATIEMSMSGTSPSYSGQIKLFMKINLVETSVPGLISDNIIWWIIIGVIIAVVVTVVIVTLYIVMRRRKALAPPAPPSVTPLAPNYCPTCGSPVNPEDVYCGKCGRKLK